MTRLANLVLVVRSLERALAVYEHGLGFERLGEPQDVPSMGARHVFLRAANCTLELLEPHDDARPPGAFLAARGEGVFALAMEPEDPPAARDRLRDVGVEARGAGGERWYVRPADAQGVLIELAGAESE